MEGKFQSALHKQCEPETADWRVQCLYTKILSCKSILIIKMKMQFDIEQAAQHIVRLSKLNKTSLGPTSWYRNENSNRIT